MVNNTVMHFEGTRLSPQTELERAAAEYRRFEKAEAALRTALTALREAGRAIEQAGLLVREATGLDPHWGGELTDKVLARQRLTEVAARNGQ